MPDDPTTLDRAIAHCRNAHGDNCVMDVGDHDGVLCNAENCIAYREIEEMASDATTAPEPLQFCDGGCCFEAAPCQRCIAKAAAQNTTAGHDRVSWAYGWAAGRRGDKLTTLQIPAWLNVDEFERGREVGKTENPFTMSGSNDREFEGAIARFYSKLLTDQEPLGREFEQVLHANLWDLYVRS